MASRPENVKNTKVDAEVAFWSPGQYRHVGPIEATDSEVDRAADVLLRASAPKLHAGSGVVHAQALDELRAVAEFLQGPVTTSWSGRGVLDERLAVAIPMYHVKLNHLVRNEADDGAGAGLADRRDRLVGEAALLAARAGTAAGAGGH